MIPLTNPCCCITTCQLATDAFTRADSSDINDGAPITYDVVSGTWSIASNKLAVSSTNAKILFPSLGNSPLDARSFSITVSGSTGDVVIFYVGDYTIEITIGTTGTLYVKDSGAAVVFKCGYNTASATNHAFVLGQGPFVGNNGFLSGRFNGIYLSGASGQINIALDCPVGGTDFGIGTGGTAAGLTFDTLTISENTFLTNGTGGCVGSSVFACDIRSTSISALGPEWTVDSGTWAKTNSSSNQVTCSGAPGKLLLATPTHHLDNFQITSSPSLNACWLDDQETGMRISASTVNSIDIEFLVDGAVVDTLSWVGVFWSNVSMQLTSFNGIVYAYVSGSGFGFTPKYSSAEWASPSFNISFETTATGTFSLGAFSSASGNGFYSCNDSSANAVISAPCTGTATYDITFSGATGTSSGDVNGTSFSLSSSSGGSNRVASAIDLGGERALSQCVIDWHAIDVNGTSVRLTVVIRFKNAWAMFIKDYASPPACNSLTSESLTLYDYYSTSDLNMSAATCVVDS